MTCEKSGREGSVGFLNGVLSAFVLVIAWIFVMGWTYLHTYYACFGVNVNSLDFPVYHYLTFCYAQFVSFHWGGLLVALMLLALFFVTWAGTSVKRKTLALVIATAYLLLFWGGFHIAIRNGKTAALEDMGLSSPLPQVVLEIKSTEKPSDSSVEEALGSANLRLLLETGDRLFVFEPVYTKSNVLRVHVLEISRGETPFFMRIARMW